MPLNDRGLTVKTPENRLSALFAVPVESTVRKHQGLSAQEMKELTGHCGWIDEPDKEDRGNATGCFPSRFGVLEG